ncbi:MAG: hypothetical protein U0R21_02610 [Nocardioidaceae bacterium]
MDVLVGQLTAEVLPRNVAIAGAYGSGKSSVLAGLRKRLGRSRKVVEVSLASLNQSDETLLRISGEDNLTAALQKEVVKRLLYSARPSTLPKSRFARIGGVRWWRAFGVALVAATAFMGLFFLLSLPTPLAHWSYSWKGEWVTRRSLGPLLDWIALAAVFVAGQALFSTTRLSEIGIGAAKLSLTEKGGDYFDRYLDEIVYFFEKSKTRVVFFEDLDRFDDPGIFQALRELNNLLNGSPQLKQPITFVHAVRDSLFERVSDGDEAQGDAGAESAGHATDSIARIGSESAASDRAKFFDLVVPLVPFISHEVSADLFVEAFKDVPEDRRPSTKLMSLAGKYVTDMRVIHSIRNEYAVFTSELLDKSAVEGLKDGRDQLFAMVLYKHLYLLDFERIRTGDSKLDRVVALVSELTRHRLAGLDTKIADLTNDIDRSAAVERRAQEAGQRLLDSLAFLIRVAHGVGGVQTVAIDDGGRYTPEQLLDRAFWDEFASPAAAAAAQLTVTTDRNQSVAVQISDLPRLLGADHPVSDWLRSADDVTRRELSDARALRERLSRAPLSDRASDATFAGQGISETGEAVEINIHASVEEVLGEGLALDLVRGGYVDQNFALFTTKFHGQIISPSARTYLMQHVDRHQPDYRFHLTSTDVATVLERTQGSVLDDPSGLNLSIVGYLLDKPALESVVAVLLRQPPHQLQDFVLTYLAEGADGERFIERLTPSWSDVVDLIATSERISDASRRRLLSVALGSLDPDVDYAVSEAATVVLRRELDSLPLSTSPVSESAATALTRLIARIGHRFASLLNIPDPLRRSLGLAGAFDVTRENLEAIVGGSRIGLDSLVDVGEALGRYVAGEAGDYLSALDAAPLASSLDNEDRLDQVVRLVLADAPAELDPLLLHMGNASYEDLSTAPGEAYPALARTGRFGASAANVKTYIDQVGAIDGDLTSMLEKAGAMSVDDETAQDLRVEVATALVNAEHGSVDSKIALVKSLRLEDCLDPATINLDDPELVSGLLAAGELEDSAGTFQALVAGPWEVFAAALGASSGVGGFLHEVQFSDDRLADIMTRTGVADDVRAAVLKHLPTFLPVVAAKSAPVITNYAVSKGADLTPDALVVLARAGAGTQVVIYLYKKHSGLSNDALVQVLNAVGVPYSNLTTTNGSAFAVPFAKELKSVLERLRLAGLVKSYRKATRKDHFDVEMN